MKSKLFVTAVAALICQALWAQQFTPPALPPGVKAGGEMAESEITKVYSLEDQGATFRAYAVKYKGSEVVISDTLARSNKQVGDKVRFMVTRVEAPVGAEKVKVMSFQIMEFNLPKKK